MRALVTGMNGTVAPVLARALVASGAEVVAWDRGADPPRSREAVAETVRREAPGWVCHLATGPEAWAGWVAEACAASGVRVLLTSSVSVFAPRDAGPIPPEATPDATDDYGRYKARAEALVREAAPRALIARLGWQIGRAPGSNTMTDWMHREGTAHDVVRASAHWRPACSWLEDTADALVRLMASGDGASGGTYHLDGCGPLTFYDLALGLRAHLGGGWRVERTEEPRMDLRMADPRVRVRPVAERLPPRG